MSEIILDDNNFKSEILEHEGLAIVDFWASWCGPCRMMGPIFEETAKEASGLAKFGKVNVDECKVASEYGIMSIPTLLIFKNGEKVDTMVGVQDKETLISKLKEHSES